MSVINKMLQDLEQRQAGEGAVAAGAGSHVRVTPQQRKTYLAWAVAALSLAALMTVLLLVWLQPVAVVNVARRLAPQLILKPTFSLQTVPPTLPAPQADQPTPSAVQQAPQSNVEAPITQASQPAESAALESRPQPATQSATSAVPMPEAVAAFPADEEKKSAAIGKPEAAQQAEQTHAQKKAAAKSLEQHSSDKITISAASSRPRQPAAPERQLQENSQTLEKQIKPLTPQQQAENDARKALVLVQQGQISAAISLLDQVLQLAPENADARQTLIAALLRNGNADQAMVRAQEGLALNIRQTGFAMILARLQVEKGQQKTAIATLQHSLPYAENQPEYPAFLAALLQREKRHKEAIDQYLQALHNAPDNGVWWMGLGISLQAEKRDAEARQAFTRARESASLSPSLQAFVEQKLKQLSP